MPGTAEPRDDCLKVSHTVEDILSMLTIEEEVRVAVLVPSDRFYALLYQLSLLRSEKLSSPKTQPLPRSSVEP